MMKPSLQAINRGTQRGVAAVEAAIVLPVLVLFLTFPTIFYAAYFYQYSAAQKAVRDASLYLSTATKYEWALPGPDGRPAAMTLADKIFAKEMAGLSPPDLSVVCNYRQPSTTVVARQCSVANSLSNQKLVGVTVSLVMSFKDPTTGTASGLWIMPYVDVPYVGN